MLFNDKSLVINEMIEITKILSPDNSYKFVHAVLDKLKGKKDEKK